MKNDHGNLAINYCCQSRKRSGGSDIASLIRILSELPSLFLVRQ